MPTSKTIGALAAHAWLAQRGLDASQTPHWFVEISIPSDVPDTRFELNVYPEEWGFIFRRGVRVSSIRVTDVAFVHGFDDYRLLAETPALEDIAVLLSTLDERYTITFDRTRASVRSNLTRAAAVVRPWLVTRR